MQIQTCLVLEVGKEERGVDRLVLLAGDAALLSSVLECRTAGDEMRRGNAHTGTRQPHRNERTTEDSC